MTRFNITYRAASDSGHLSGVHDGFPSYQVLKGGREIYSHTQGFIGQLVGTGDRSVDKDF
jgi:hypothetical protein